MDIHARERIILLLDGKDMNSAQYALNFSIDFKKLLAMFRSRGRLVRSIYYIPVSDRESQRERPFVEWLDYNGYQVVAKPVHDSIDADGRQRLHGDTRLEMAVDAMDLADHADHFVLFASHGSFAHLATALKRRGKRVSVVATLEREPFVSDMLRRRCDQFVDYVDLEPLIARDVETPAPETPPPKKAADEAPSRSATEVGTASQKKPNAKPKTVRQG